MPRQSPPPASLILEYVPELLMAGDYDTSGPKLSGSLRRLRRSLTFDLTGSLVIKLIGRDL